MKKIIALFIAVLIISCLALPCFAGEYMAITDAAELLTDSERTEICGIIDEICERQQFDIAILTLDSLEGNSPMATADDFYDEYNFGYGSDKDGCVLLVSMEERDYWISTRGFGITALTDYGIEQIGSVIQPYLSSGNYGEAFRQFAYLCDEYVTSAKAGSPIDAGSYNASSANTKKPWAKYVIIALLAGAAIGFIPVLIMKSKLKTVSFKAEAADYVRSGSFNLTGSHDIFLYSTVSKVKRQTNNSGGSSTHTSSSGATHGGGGGKF